MKNVFLLLSFFMITLGFSQEKSRTIRFEIFTEENDPLAGVSITEKGTENGAQTDLQGKAELKVNNIDNKIEIYFLGPYLVIDLIEKADLVKVTISKKSKAEYYKNGKRIKKKKIKYSYVKTRTRHLQ